ncbi:hypothetical protein NKI96_11100 [Mesorhizobium sp. M0292]|uniref:hypothetical protein n=1 Tax=Mesorhizobium sp. M0292 TaxID=2956929 RepID=UPI003336F8F4
MAPSTEEAEKISAAHDAGFTEGLIQGKREGAAAERSRFASIVRLCDGNRRHLEGAVDLALSLPEISAERAVEMATGFFHTVESSTQIRLSGGSSYLMGSVSDPLARFGR